MKDRARLFAYTTWVVMISLAITVFTNPFLSYIADPEWIGLAVLLGFGFIYLNFTYLATRRFIRKVLAETRLHLLIALLVWLPPAAWITLLSDEVGGSSRVLLLAVLAFSCLLGAFYGYRSGKREQQKHLKRVQEGG